MPSGGFITGYVVTSGGSGYVTAPAVTIFGGGGSGAAATANLSGGVVASLTVNNTGNGAYCPEADAIADPCAFLLSDKARFISESLRVEMMSVCVYHFTPATPLITFCSTIHSQFRPPPRSDWARINILTSRAWRLEIEVDMIGVCPAVSFVARRTKSLRYNPCL